MKPKKYHYVYETKNLINNKIYVGKHSTNNLDDEYIGSGTLLRRAINKHKKENFQKIILKYFNSKEEALKHEATIVTKEFVNRKDTYNLAIGGMGSTYGGASVNEVTKEKMRKVYANRTKENKKLLV